MKPWDEIAQDPASGFIFSNVYGYAFSKLNPERPSGRPANHMLTIITLTPSSYWLHSDPSPLFWQRAHHDHSFIPSIVLNLKKASNKCTPNCQPTPSGLGHIYGLIIIQSHLRLSQFHLLLPRGDPPRLTEHWNLLLTTISFPSLTENGLSQTFPSSKLRHDQLWQGVRGAGCLVVVWSVANNAHFEVSFSWS